MPACRSSAPVPCSVRVSGRPLPAGAASATVRPAVYTSRPRFRRAGRMARLSCQPRRCNGEPLLAAAREPLTSSPAALSSPLLPHAADRLRLRLRLRDCRVSDSIPARWRGRGGGSFAPCASRSAWVGGRNCPISFFSVFITYELGQTENGGKLANKEVLNPRFLCLALFLVSLYL